MNDGTLGVLTVPSNTWICISGYFSCISCSKENSLFDPTDTSTGNLDISDKSESHFFTITLVSISVHTATLAICVGSRVPVRLKIRLCHGQSKNGNVKHFIVVSYFPKKKMNKNGKRSDEESTDTKNLGSKLFFPTNFFSMSFVSHLLQVRQDIDELRHNQLCIREELKKMHMMLRTDMYVEPMRSSNILLTQESLRRPQTKPASTYRWTRVRLSSRCLVASDIDYWPNIS